MQNTFNVDIQTIGGKTSGTRFSRKLRRQLDDSRLEVASLNLFVQGVTAQLEALGAAAKQLDGSLDAEMAPAARAGVYEPGPQFAEPVRAAMDVHAVRAAAHHLWLGGAEGDALAHWLVAERMVAATVSQVIHGTARMDERGPNVFRLRRPRAVDEAAFCRLVRNAVVAEIKKADMSDAYVVGVEREETTYRVRVTFAAADTHVRPPL
jgi:hypothetical protein